MTGVGWWDSGTGLATVRFISVSGQPGRKSVSKDFGFCFGTCTTRVAAGISERNHLLQPGPDLVIHKYKIGETLEQGFHCFRHVRYTCLLCDNVVPLTLTQPRTPKSLLQPPTMAPKNRIIIDTDPGSSLVCIPCPWLVANTLPRRRRCHGPAAGPQRLARGPRGCHDLGHIRQCAATEVRPGPVFAALVDTHCDTLCGMLSDTGAPVVFAMSWPCSMCSRRRWPGGHPAASPPMEPYTPTSPSWLSAPSILSRMSSS